ncbi:MAG: hypothetical protein Fur0010_24930 [Bdellovibrio sp.]
MSESYIQAEFDKVFNDNKFTAPMNSAMACAWVMGNFKGFNLRVLDTSKRSSLSDYFIICSASNPTQAESMANEILFQFKRHGILPVSSEGLRGSDWILIDLGDVIAHIFVDTAREAYGLDELYASAPPVKVPDEFYFSGTEETGGEKGYF